MNSIRIVKNLSNVMIALNGHFVAEHLKMRSKKMYFKSVMEELNKYGVKMSRNNLYRVGKNRGFFIKTEKGLEFNKSVFNEWLGEILMKPQEGYISIMEASEKYGISYSKAYQFFVEIRKNNPKYIISCGRRHKGYIYEQEFEKIIKEDKNKHSEF